MAFAMKNAGKTYGKRIPLMAIEYVLSKGNF